MDSKRIENNAKYVAMFFMQYTILIPLMHYINATIVIALSGIILIALILLNNHCRYVNAKVFGFYFALLFIFLIKSVIGHISLISILYLFVFVGPPAFMFLYPFDYKACIRDLIFLSRIGFLMICWNPFTSFYSYMRFGYGMLPVIILVYVDFFYYKAGELDEKSTRFIKIIDLVIMIIGSLELLVYGARGGTFALILFIALDRILINRAHYFRNGIIIAGAIIAYLNIVPILNLVESVAREIGVYSYSITKFKMQLSGGFEYASSGRSNMYSAVLEKIRSSPLIGNSISLDETGGDYAHNLFLQVGEDLGVVAILILSLFLVYVLFQLAKKDISREEKILIILLLSTSVGRLMFSSTIWRRPEFWMLICFCLSFKTNRRINPQKERNEK